MSRTKSVKEQPKRITSDIWRILYTIIGPVNVWHTKNFPARSKTVPGEHVLVKRVTRKSTS